MSPRWALIEVCAPKGRGIAGNPTVKSTNIGGGRMTAEDAKRRDAFPRIAWEQANSLNDENIVVAPS